MKVSHSQYKDLLDRANKTRDEWSEATSTHTDYPNRGRWIRAEFSKLQRTYPELAQWRLEFNSRAVRRHGCCKYSKKTLELSTTLLEHATPHDIYDTLTHEAAHALLPGDYHGPRWVRLHQAMGGSGERCGQKHTKQEYKYYLVCPNGHAIGRNKQTGEELYALGRHRVDRRLKGCVCHKCRTQIEAVPADVYEERTE